MDRVDVFTAAHILGCTPTDARTLLPTATITRDDVEDLAMTRYRWRLHTHDPDTYWCTVAQAADQVLGVSRQRVKQLLDADLLPYRTHTDGTRLMRRAQLETVANARRVRYHPAART